MNCGHPFSCRTSRSTNSFNSVSRAQTQTSLSGICGGPSGRGTKFFTGYTHLLLSLLFKQFFIVTFTFTNFLSRNTNEGGLGASQQKCCCLENCFGKLRSVNGNIYIYYIYRLYIYIYILLLASNIS